MKCMTNVRYLSRHVRQRKQVYIYKQNCPCRSIDESYYTYSSKWRQSWSLRRFEYFERALGEKERNLHIDYILDIRSIVRHV